MALKGIRVIELAGLAPVPFAGLILADWGAEVIRIDRTEALGVVDDILTRGKRSIIVDLRSKEGVQLARDMIAQADVLLDPFRPGVLERIGLGPEVFLGLELDGRGATALNDRLVYARIAGCLVLNVRTGPQREHAGHDLNYLATSGVLDALPKETDGKPSFPLNILADFAGGGQMERRSGRGQVVSTDMVSGARYVSTFALAHAQNPESFIPRLLGGSAPFYSVYRCQDDRYMSVACLEPKFFAAFLTAFKKNLPDGFVVPDQVPGFPQLDAQAGRDSWPELKRYLDHGFLTRSMVDWTQRFANEKDACVSPVLTPLEANARRGEPGPLPHPALSRTPALVSHNEPESKLARGAASLDLGRLMPGKDTREVLRDFGYSEQRIHEHVQAGTTQVASHRSKL
ncbi:CoA-transferase family III [Auriculariales sp. MPI-PUGE-AT-0066]|nr:CoA-transferase family III [Auriculariales sp. MPI-PUGE-AT-0066]